MKKWKEIPVASILGDAGSLRVLEQLGSSSFIPRRVFWISNVPAGQTRGFHAHKTGHQILICLAGSVSAKFDNGTVSEDILLLPGGMAVWMENMVWGEQTFLEKDSILLVLASNEYDEEDYIRDRNEFEALAQ
jgi:dTDP-4-dehydrorhamnose 3,5-epimerase-like enzyme